MALLPAITSAEELAQTVTPRPDGTYAVASRTWPGRVYTTTADTCDCKAGEHDRPCWHREAVLVYRRRLELRGIPFMLPAGEPILGIRQQVRDQLSDWGCWSNGALWFTHDRPVQVAPGMETPPGLAIGALILERWWGKRNPTIEEVGEVWVKASQRGFHEMRDREEQRAA